MIGDIGAGEFAVIAIIAVLILGPDKLPRAIATVLSWTRMLREQAAKARTEIVAAADVDPTISADLKRSVQDLAELHPKRLAQSFITDAVPQTPSSPMTPAPRPSSGPSAPGGASPAAFDPDAT